MSLVTFKDILPDAQARGYAVGSFGVWDIYSAKSLMNCAERLRAPVIFSLWQTEIDYAGEKQLWQTCLSFAKDSPLPACVFIDHAKTIEEMRRAIDCGATSVMIDGSHFSLEKNIEFTARAAEIAHRAGVSIEGELGILGEESGSDPDERLYTNVAEAERFARETSIDALAISIGNAHGFYKKEPKLDFDRLANIRKCVSIPLVLHGGTGIPDSDIRRAISLGITKINIGAEGRKAFMDGLRDSLSKLPRDEKYPHIIFPAAISAYAAVLEDKIKLFKSDGKAC